MKKRKFVFGLGTGCCGTSSLAYLLNEQKDAFVGHELFPILPWSTEQDARQFFIDNKWEQLNHESHLYGMVGDVASYYLPYIRFLMFNLESLKDEVDFKFIILRRDRSEVINAFIEKFTRQKNNPFQYNKTNGIRSDVWDHSFPKYDSSATLEECIGWYYDDYYAECDNYLQKWPDYFMTMNVQDLNNEKKVLKLLEFLDVKNPRLIVSRKNRREDGTIF